MKALLFIFCLSASALLQVNSLESINLNNVIVNYMNKGSETDFYLISNLKAPANVNNAWLSVALNSQTGMNGGIAVVCSNNNGVSKIEHYYLNGNQPQLIDNNNPSIGLKDIRVEINQGYLVCQFTRDNNFNKFIGQIDTGFAYMLVAFGSGSLSYHGSNRAHTDFKIKIAEPLTLPPTFPTNPPTIPTLPTNPPTFPTNPPTFPTLPTNPPTFPTNPPTFPTLPTNPPTFPTNPPTFPTNPTPFPTNPAMSGSYASQTYQLLWRNGVETTDFTLSSAVGSSPNQWIGMGFSNDQMMGEDNVVICKFFCNNGACTGTAENRFNNGRNVELVNADPQFGLSNIRVQFENGRLTCSFTRVNQIPGIARYYNSVSRPYYLLNAKGPTDQNGNIFYHQQREASPDVMTFTQGFETLPTVPTGGPFTTPRPVGPVQPLGQVIDQVAQAVLGFVNFLTRLFN